MIITISGTPGSGKSTIAKILAEKWQAERIYVGGMRRELARRKGMSLQELNQYAKTHPETDVDVDREAAKRARELNHAGKKVIDEGYVQHHFLPQAIKIFIKVDPGEGARRIWKDLQKPQARRERNEGSIASLEEMKKRVRERLKEDDQRYQQYYGLHYLDESQYDLVVDTTALTPEEGAQRIIGFVENISPLTSSRKAYK